MIDWIVIGLNLFTCAVIVASSWMDIKRRTREGERAIAMLRRMHELESMIYSLDRRLAKVEKSD